MDSWRLPLSMPCSFDMDQKIAKICNFRYTGEQCEVNVFYD